MIFLDFWLGQKTCLFPIFNFMEKKIWFTISLYLHEYVSYLNFRVTAAAKKWEVRAIGRIPWLSWFLASLHSRVSRNESRRTEGGWFEEGKKKLAPHLLAINNRYYALHYGIEKAREAVQQQRLGERHTRHVREFIKKLLQNDA